MGKIIVNFFYEGNNIAESQQLPFGLYQSLRERHAVDNIENLNFDGDNHIVNFEIDIEGNGVNWEAISYPNEEIREKVKEIFYFQSIREQLHDILSSVNRCNFEDRYKLDVIGRRAIDIISDIQAGKHYNTDYSSYHYLQKIGQTLREEVSSLERLRDKDSGSAKQRSLSGAKRHLVNDIRMVIDVIAVR